MKIKNINTLLLKYLPQIDKFFKKKEIKASIDDYINTLKIFIEREIGEKLSISDIKNELKNLKFDENGGMDEFVNSDGSFISGDWTSGKREIFVGKNRPETSREFAQFTAQGPRYYFKSTGASKAYTRESVGETKMKNMIEDFMKTGRDDRDVIKKDDQTDIIPDITVLKDNFQKPIIVRKTRYLTDMMDREGVSGEEIGIILNHIITNLDVSQIPSDYKNSLINKLNGKR